MWCLYNATFYVCIPSWYLILISTIISYITNSLNIIYDGFFTGKCKIILADQFWSLANCRIFFLLAVPQIVEEKTNIGWMFEL